MCTVYVLPAKRVGYMGLVWAEKKLYPYTLHNPAITGCVSAISLVL